MNKKRILRILLGFALLFLLQGCGSPLSGREKQVLETINLQTETDIPETEKSTETETAKDAGIESEGKVYVCGAVNNPGVYSFTEGDRRVDALKAAGGATEEAATDAVNLAQPLQDGEMIRIPTKEEVLSGTVPEASDFSSEDGKININTADVSQLQTLPGVGESRALQIIAYREENGPFGKPEDIMNVSGIKEGLYAKLKDHIKVGG